MVKALADREAAVRISVASALASVDAVQAKTAVPVLLEILKDRDAENRRGAVFVLGQIGPDAREALPALKQSLKDPSSEVRQAVENSLKAIDASK
jgi:HEAT repeat protein